MIPLLPWLAAQSVAGQETFLPVSRRRPRADRPRTRRGLESQFAFLKRLDFHAEMGKRAASSATRTSRRRVSEALLAAAASLPTLLLAPFFAFFFLRDGTLFTKLVTRGVPNAFFERTVYMFERVDATAKSYFQGLLKLTAVDTFVLGVGFFAVGVPNAFVHRADRRHPRMDPDRRLGHRLRARRAGGRHRAPERPVGRVWRRRRVRGQPRARQLLLHTAHGRAQHPHAPLADRAAWCSSVAPWPAFPA
jgi:hypothetical protein